jgi:ribosomal protein S12 methylthiotransferase
MKKSTPAICIVSLGCAKNQVDSEVMSASILREGFTFVQDPSEADVIVLNSCSFIRDAVEESLEFLDSLSRYREEGRCICLVLAGCLVERYGEELQEPLPQVDLFVGMKAEEGIGEILRRHLQGDSPGSFLLETPFRDETPEWSPTQNREALGVWAYVKVAEGCSNRCAYCTIPEIRGPLTSRDPEDIHREVSNLARSGVQEINLVAQDVAAYGHDCGTGGRSSLPELLRELHGIEDVRWIRLLYCHPAHVDSSLVAAMGDLDKICPYLDFPIQHVSARILKAMNRPYDIRTLRSRIRDFRSARPDIALRTTVMVGFPGEREEDVEELLRFLEEIRFHHLGVFRYSPEPGTAAFQTEDDVSQEEKEERFQAVMDLQAGISEEIQQGYVGTVQEVLVEGEHEEDPRLIKARTRFQAPEVDGVVLIQPQNPIPPGLNTARITESLTYDLSAELCDTSRPS